jgi:hypothetical protein
MLADAFLFLGFDLAVLILLAVLACLRVFRCSVGRPQKRTGGGNG